MGDKLTGVMGYHTELWVEAGFRASMKTRGVEERSAPQSQCPEKGFKRIGVEEGVG